MKRDLSIKQGIILRNIASILFIMNLNVKVKLRKTSTRNYKISKLGVQPAILIAAILNNYNI